jgi:hypothetical protein
MVFQSYPRPSSLFSQAYETSTDKVLALESFSKLTFMGFMCKKIAQTKESYNLVVKI